MTDDERARLRRSWQPVADALLELETARKIKDRKFWDLVDALIGFRMTMKETQVLDSDEEAQDEQGILDPDR